MCDRWSRNDQRIKTIHKQNQGLNFARRDGYSISTGDYVIFVDSDDVIAKSYVKSLLDVAQAYAADVVITGMRKFNNIAELRFEEVNDIEIFQEDNKKTILSWLIGWDFPWNENIYIMTAWGKLYKKRVVDAIDWNFSNYTANEDEFWTLQAFNNTKNSIVMTNTRLYGYRKNDESITHKRYSNIYEGKRLDKFQFLERLYLESLQYIGNDYQKLLLRRLGVNLVDFVDIYTDRSTMGLHNILSAQRLLNKYKKSILDCSEDARVRRKIKRMVRLSILGYIINRKMQHARTRN